MLKRNTLIIHSFREWRGDRTETTGKKVIKRGMKFQGVELPKDEFAYMEDTYEEVRETKLEV